MRTLADLARRLKRPGERLPRVFFFTDSRRVPAPLAAIKALPDGCGVVFRDYERPDREALAGKMAAECRKRRLVLLVAGDAGLAARVGADGIHMPEWMVWSRPGPIRPGWLVTAAAHSARAARRAESLGADAVFASPAFPTKSHPGRKTLGVSGLARIRKATNLPVYALGGIDGARAEILLRAEIHGFAAIEALLEK